MIIRIVLLFVLIVGVQPIMCAQGKVMHSKIIYINETYPPASKAVNVSTFYDVETLSPVFEFITNPGFHITVAESIQVMLKEVLNIDMIIRQEEWAVLLQTRREGNFDMARQGWIGGYNNPMSFLSLVKTGYVLNEGKYSNPDFDKSLNDADFAESDTDRSMYMHKAEGIAMNDMAIIPIFYYSGTVMQSPKLTNVIYDVFGIYNFSKAEIIK